MVRITFSGDVTCDRPMLKATKKKGYDFSGMLDNLRPMLRESDCIVGNLETVFGSDKTVYNYDVRYNSPDSLLDEFINAGFTLFTTANNHCFDCGAYGLNRTLDLLDKNGIAHTGTFRNTDESKYCILETGGIKVAFFSYTYGLNRYRGFDYSELSNDIINSFAKLDFPTVKKDRLSLLRKLRIRTRIKILLGIPTIEATTDFCYDGIFNKKMLNDLAEQINKAKIESDFVVFCLHAGGQFNEVPGQYVQSLMRILEEDGADFVIGHHPHTIQKISTVNGKPFAYSLGGLNMSPSADYIYRQCKPEYSLIMNLNFDGETKTFVDSTFSLVKAVEDKNHFLKVYPVHELYRMVSVAEKEKLLCDVNSLLERIYGKKHCFEDILAEYPVIM